MNAAALLTSVALLLHSLLGCCWHHAHESNEEIHSVCLEHDHASGGGDHDGEHSSESHCQAARCVFITTPGPDLDLVATNVAIATLDALYVASDASLAVLMTAWSSHAPPVPAVEVQPLMLRI